MRAVVLRTRGGRAIAVGVSGQSLNLIAELDPANIAPAPTELVRRCTGGAVAVNATV
ncbi:MAG: hypothetical protein ACREP7_09800 [Lysobacter sp.]